MKFLVIQQKMIGDVLTSSVLCQALKLHYLNCEVHYIINFNTLAVVENNPFIDKIIIVDKDTTQSVYRLIKFAISLKNESYYAVIDAYGALSSMVMSYFTKAETKISYHKSYSSFIYDKTVKRISQPQHNFSLALENRMRLLNPLGMDFKKILPKIYLKDSEIESGKLFLQENRINLDEELYMISVVGSSSDKTYPYKYMAELIDYLVELKPNCQILFNYIPSQLDDAREIYSNTQLETQNHILFDVYAKDLRSFLTVTAHCDAVIGNEGGANNMAKALEIPTFTIFAPYLNKHNWFGEIEEDEHVAVHLADYQKMEVDQVKQAKQNPIPFYQRMKPELFKSKLNMFISNLD